METTVSGKGQVTIPAELRKKYGIQKGMKIMIVEEPRGLLLRHVPHMNDWAGEDAGKYSYSEITKKLDRFRGRKGYKACLAGLRYKEESHEASRYLFKKN